MAILKTEDFTLEVVFRHNKNTFLFNNYITDTTAKMAVSCFDYSGVTEFAVSIEECTAFVKDISELFDGLKEGLTGISDYEPEQNNLYFKSDGAGHFNISGIFNNWGEWTLKFEKNIEQTYFKNFIKQLNDEFVSIF